jgi:putative tributyrin esterase
MSRTVLVCFATLVAAAFPAEVEKNVAAKNITTVQVHSASLGQERSMNVLLPADYDSSTERYPVLYLLHGYGDDHTAWSYMTNLSGYAAAHRIIIAMPDGARSFYINSAGDPEARFEDFIAKDVVGYMDSNYRTIPLRRARFIAGLSMGGYGAALLGLKHFDDFSVIGSFSGVLALTHESPEDRRDPKRRAELETLIGPVGSAARQEHDPFAAIEKVPPARMPLLYIVCGGQDHLVDQNRVFVAMLASKKIPYEYREVSPRVHSWDFWDEQIQVFLDLIDPR